MVAGRAKKLSSVAHCTCGAAARHSAGRCDGRKRETDMMVVMMVVMVAVVAMVVVVVVVVRGARSSAR